MHMELETEKMPTIIRQQSGRQEPHAKRGSVEGQTAGAGTLMHCGDASQAWTVHLWTSC